jgi:hypothetical protein
MMSVMLDQIVPWGRSLDEYRRMFSLSDEDSRKNILGCGDGPASFNAEMTALGYHVISCDPIYAFSREQIEQRVNDTYDTIVSQVRETPHHYVWKDFKDADDLGQHRLQAMRLFLEDYDRGKREGRYIEASLPSLNFSDHQFDLALCSHLLFLYSEHLSLDFHIASIAELCRVAGEVRIFPLLDLNVEKSPHLIPVCDHFSNDGYNVDIERVNYEFQVGGNEMLRIMRRKL